MRDSEQSGGRRVLSIGMELALDLFGAEIPEEVEHWVRSDSVAAALASRVREQLLAEIDVEMGGSESKINTFYMAALLRPIDKFKLLLDILRPAWFEFALLPLPPLLYPLYCMWRPFRLLGKYTERCLKHFL